MNKFRILKLDEVIGENKLSIFKHIALSTDITDFAIASGTFSFKDLDSLTTGMYWLDDAVLGENKAYVVGINSDIDKVCKYEKSIAGLRIAVKYSDIQDDIICETKIDDSLSVIQYGFYPKSLVREFTYPEFVRLYDSKEINETEQTCILPRLTYGMFSKFGVTEKKILQYNQINFIEYNMEHVICALNGEKYFKGSPMLFKVEPINWFVDKEKDVAVTEDVIVGGIPFSSSVDMLSNNEDINEYLEYFEKSIVKKVDEKVKRKKYN